MIRTSAQRALGIGLLAGATLLAELILTRVLSAGLYHHIAFVVLSTALLGTGVAAVWVSTRTQRGALADHVPGRAALLFAVSLPLCFALSQWVGAEPLMVAEDPAQGLRMGLTYGLLAVPFFFAGLGISALLTQHTQEATRLYGADLLGAAAGSLTGLFAVHLARGPDALWLAAAGGAGAAWALWGPRAKGRGLPGALSGLLVLLSLVRVLVPGGSWLPLHISASKTTRGGEPFSEVLADPARTPMTTWTTGARVDRVRFAQGLDRLVIDAGTAAVRIPPGDFRPAKSDATLPYELHPGGRFLILGAGAGWEVAEALAFGAREVHAVEINPAVAAQVPASLAQDPRVQLVVDEGRSFAERAEGPYDGIIMVHTISNAASASGALHLAEDFLLTQEALERFFELLSPHGLLFITRPEVQLPRLLNTARAASAGSIGARSMLWAERSRGSSFYGALLVSPQRLDPAVQATVRERIASRRGLRLIAGPGQVPSDPLFEALLAEPFHGTAAQALSPSLLTPAEDDRPFFHQRRRLSDLRWADVTAALSSQSRARMALEDQPLAELSSVVVLLETVVVGGLALMLPVLLGRRRRGNGPAPRGVGRVVLYFSGLGLGFMLLEVSLIQRLSLLLGQPALAIAVVFTGLLVGAGLGSLLAPRWPQPRMAVVFAAAWTLVLAFLLPALSRYGLGWSAAARVPLAFLVAFFTGLALGSPFPLGLQRLDAPWVPWAFAVNAFTSVAATVLALLLAAELGFFVVTLVAAGAYGLAAASFPRAHSTHEGPP